MSSSIRLVLILVALAIVAAAASVVFIYRQDDRQATITAEQITGGHVDAGKAAIARYGCGACHQIQGIDGAEGKVGPSLDAVAARAEIAGRLANRPSNMVVWLRRPQSVVPGSGMPDQGITDREARDITAYLYTLRN